MSTIKGHCRCGQVSYQLSEAPFNSGYCHCTDCRERTSSACTSFMMVDKDAIQLSGDTQRYMDTGGSGAPLEIHRCTQCGGVAYMQVHALKNVAAIPAETLEDKSHFKPIAHVWVSSKEDWFDIQDDLPQLPGPPRIPRELLNI